MTLTNHRLYLLEQFNALADSIQARVDDVIVQLTRFETYKTAQIEIQKTIRALQNYKHELALLEKRRPIGQVAICLPFNNPLYSLVLYCFGPLLGGNNVIVRPSELTASFLSWFVSEFDCEFFKSKLKLYFGRKSDFLSNASNTSEIACIMLTGNWTTAQTVMNEIPSSTKLIYSGSGLNPFIVLPGSDIQAAVKAAIYSKTYNSGQDCLSSERFYVVSAVYDDFLAQLAASVDKLIVGDNNDPNTDIGQLISQNAAIRLERILKDNSNNTSIVRGGHRLGSLFYPTIALCSPTSAVMLAEKYGPIFALSRVANNIEAEAYANNCDYALGATVFGDITAYPIQLDAPHVALNFCLLRWEEEDAHRKFGGTKCSGFVRQNGITATGPILYSQEATVVVD